jgi:transposase InsO family protein
MNTLRRANCCTWTSRSWAGSGVRFTRVVTDNGSCYRSRPFRRLLRRLGLRHIRTRPYTPRTNGKAERFIQTRLREWAHVATDTTSHQRRQALQDWLYHYKCHRPHSALGGSHPSTGYRSAETT